MQLENETCVHGAIGVCRRWGQVRLYRDMGAPSQQPPQLQNRVGWLEVGAGAGKAESLGISRVGKAL